MKQLSGYLQISLVAGILILVNVLASSFHRYIDLTEDQRYTLSQPSAELLDRLDDVIYVEVLLDGKFPAGFKRLQTATADMLDQMDVASGGYIEWQFKDPTEGTVEQVNSLKKHLAEQQIFPVSLTIPDADELTQRLIYPYAVIRYGQRQQVVNLLEPMVRGLSQEEALNNSVGLLEYKFASAFNKIRWARKPIVVFIDGHGEVAPREAADFEIELRKYYDTGRMHLDSVTLIPDRVDCIIIGRPRSEYSVQDKFKIDQYIMNGGKAIFILDRIQPRLDSVTANLEYVPLLSEDNLDDLLFRYGARINSDLILDLECSRIPMVVGEQGGEPQIELRPWYYFPVARAAADHPISAGLDRVQMKWVSTIDSIDTKSPIRHTTLLSTSPYTRVQRYPMRIGFEVLRYGADPDRFDKGVLPVAVLLEGIFHSLYENRVSERMHSMLAQIDQKFIAESPENSILVISDGDFIVNDIDRNTGKPERLGFNRYEGYTYANRQFLLNAVEHMTDRSEISGARSRTVKLRLLDTQRAEKQASFWRALNIAGPILILFILGGLFNYLRRRKYALR